jgi:hypothetical protein
MDNGLYRGPVPLPGRLLQIAGYQQTLVEQGKRLTPDVCLGDADAEHARTPPRQYMLPLRVWAETEYWIVVALAVRAKGGWHGRVRNSELTTARISFGWPQGRSMLSTHAKSSLRKAYWKSIYCA